MQNSGSNKHPFYLVIQTDDNLVIYDSAGVWFWNTQTNTLSPVNCYLQMRDDGNLVMYKRDGSIRWQTNSIKLSKYFMRNLCLESTITVVSIFLRFNHHNDKIHFNGKSHYFQFF
jgi:hypothetical protein